MKYTRVHRLLKLITLIQARRDWTAPKLADECGVVERTIYRDIEQLQQAGVPISFDESAKGYKVDKDFYLPPVQLTTQEALSLSLLCENVAEQEQIPFLRPAWKALAKIESQLPTDLQNEILHLSGHTAIVTAASNPPDGYIDVYEQIQRAIQSRTALRCKYEAAGSSVPGSDGESFLFEPYSLFFCVRAWYAVGHHNGRDEIRHLKLSRFSQASPTQHTYDVPEDFSIKSHLGNAWRMMRGKESHEVELRFDASFAQTIDDTLWHSTQKTDEHEDGTMTFTCTVDGLDEIVWWILGMGPHCEVIRPAALRERVREMAKRTVEIYGE